MDIRFLTWDLVESCLFVVSLPTNVCLCVRVYINGAGTVEYCRILDSLGNSCFISCFVFLIQQHLGVFVCVFGGLALSFSAHQRKVAFKLMSHVTLL